MATLMKAMVVKSGWLLNRLEQQEVQMPQMKDSDVLIKVSAAGVNRDDIDDILTGSNGVCPGLECSGIIVAVGRNVHNWQVGDRVCAILDGRGYAEQVVVPENFLLPLPDNIDLHDAAGLPFISCSIWLALSKVPKPSSLLDKTILIHEGTSEIGMLAIQYAKYWGLKVIASTGSDENLAICSHYGADMCINHKRWNLVSWVKNITQGIGVNFVLDYGSCNLKTSLDCCTMGGEVLHINVHGVKRSTIRLGYVQANHIKIKVFDLRSKNLEDKASLVKELRAHLWPAILQQRVVPVIDRHFSMIEASNAVSLLIAYENIGKVILHANFGKEETGGEREAEGTRSGHKTEQANSWSKLILQIPRLLGPYVQKIGNRVIKLN